MALLPISQPGVKKDEGKPRFDLIPWDAVEQVARVMTLGAAKYGDRNWENGLSHGRLLAAAFRHLTAYWLHKEEADLDPEFKTHHLANAACCVLMLLSSILRNLGEDDRPLRRDSVV